MRPNILQQAADAATPQTSAPSLGKGRGGSSGGSRGGCQDGSLPVCHPLPSTATPPPRFTFPFCYDPHPLSVAAVGEVQRRLAEDFPGLQEQEGKMFGVLVVRAKGSENSASSENAGHSESGSEDSLCFLAAYSGLLQGRNDWPWFVPPVFDAQQPDGHFKTTERQISSLNREIERLQSSPDFIALTAQLDAAKQESEARLSAYKTEMARAKAARDQRRKATPPPTEAELQAMVRESQFQKAELRRLRGHGEETVRAIAEQLKRFTDRIDALRRQRHTMSEALQQWLFAQYNMLDARGHRRNLLSIFSSTPQGTPPSGAGDCCAPKLLQYAYEHQLQPVCMAEFWWGKSPKSEIRHHGAYYPACRGKCLPILSHMLQGLDVEPNPLEKTEADALEVLFENAAVAVVSKPSGLLSVPGLTGGDSVLAIMGRRCPSIEGPMIVHRLDMATSGVMLVAKTEAAYHALQEQFLHHKIRKTYVARLDGIPVCPPQGTISLPLRPDPLDRPRQVVDPEHGKKAVTRYEIVGHEGGQTLVRLFPQTGRTHQLRVHCAHADGLGCPIVGDTLYGHAAERLLLHAQRIEFCDPLSGQKLAIECPVPPCFSWPEG